MLRSIHYQGFNLNLIRRFSIQILLSLCTSRRLKIIHCDLKPENILLKAKEKSGLKVIDWGSGCFQHQKIYTYIQSRFYRAPEIILGIPYSCAIDMWSFGCIIVELYTGYPLFSGDCERDQLLAIMEVKGVPPPYIIKMGERWRKFFDEKLNPFIVPNNKNVIRRPLSKDLKKILSTADEGYVDLIIRCLEYDPQTRITPEEALNHPWILEVYKKLKVMTQSAKSKK